MNAMDLPPFHYRTRIDTIHYQSFEVFERCTITLPGISITDIVIVILNYFIDGMAVFYIHLTGTITFIQKIKINSFRPKVCDSVRIYLVQ